MNTDNEKQPLLSGFLAAQAKMRDPVKDSLNPHFKSRFVSLRGVLDAVRGPLHEHGIVVTQRLAVADGVVFIDTDLLHVSGDRLTSRCPIICAKPNDPQAFGSALTYARRYALAAICGIAPADEDDDGEDATPRKAALAEPRRATKEAPAFDLSEQAISAIDECTNSLSLQVVAARVASSNFSGTDLDMVRAAYAEKQQQIIKDTNAKP